MILTVRTRTEIEVRDDLDKDQIEEIAREIIAGTCKAAQHRRYDTTFSWSKRAGKLTPWRPEKLTLAERETMSWIRGNPRLKAGPITPEIERYALSRAKGRCPECHIPWEKIKLPKHRKRAWDFHHMKRVSDRGKSTKDNIRVLCFNCHKAVHRALASHTGKSRG